MSNLDSGLSPNSPHFPENFDISQDVQITKEGQLAITIQAKDSQGNSHSIIKKINVSVLTEKNATESIKNKEVLERIKNTFQREIAAIVADTHQYVKNAAPSAHDITLPPPYNIRLIASDNGYTVERVFKDSSKTSERVGEWKGASGKGDLKVTERKEAITQAQLHVKARVAFQKICHGKQPMHIAAAIDTILKEYESDLKGCLGVSQALQDIKSKASRESSQGKIQPDHIDVLKNQVLSAMRELGINISPKAKPAPVSTPLNSAAENLETTPKPLPLTVPSSSKDKVHYDSETDVDEFSDDEELDDDSTNSEADTSKGTVADIPLDTSVESLSTVKRKDISVEKDATVVFSDTISKVVALKTAYDFTNDLNAMVKKYTATYLHEAVKEILESGSRGRTLATVLQEPGNEDLREALLKLEQQISLMVPKGKLDQLVDKLENWIGGYKVGPKHPEDNPLLIYVLENLQKNPKTISLQDTQGRMISCTQQVVRGEYRDPLIRGKVYN
ncbi:MAG: hypothetical protein JWO53_656 [Chlamydiia bacterium]|nr:hypothetical protein [Chlamydiia bacterium]